MLKVKHTFTALQPIFTGSDENHGITRNLRREKIIMRKPLELKSQFSNEELRRQAILKILLNVWRNINFETMPKSRLLGIWDEFSSKLITSTECRTRYEFINLICQKFDIRSLTDDYVVEMIDLFSDDEFLETIRNENQYLVLRLRKFINDLKNKEVDEKNLYFDFKGNTGEKITFRKSYYTVPYISGNSIRGMLRRIVMYDFCKLTGISKLDKSVYHQLFTGGNLTSSTDTEDIDRRESYIVMCPMIGLLGSAIGNMTIEGELKVGGARLRCKENGTSDLSFWEQISIVFGTRLDSSKTEQDIEVVAGGNEPVSQMKYDYEVFIVGSQFDHSFALTTENPLLVSAFWRMMELFKENNFICGNSARDSGEIDINIEIPKDASQLYLDHIEANKDKIKQYFSPKFK